jgi:hypothetical protein
VIKVTTTQEVSTERIADLLTCALEGGSNYWYMITDRGAPTEIVFRTAISDEDKASAEIVYPHIDYPVNPGGFLMIGATDDEGDVDMTEVKRLDLDSLAKGLQVMATKYPRHYADFQAENDDAETGDVFLQCCLFGEIVYG